MKDPMPVHAVIFDLGGVLVRIAGSFFEACELAQVRVLPCLYDPQFQQQAYAWSDRLHRGQQKFTDYVDGIVRLTDGQYSHEEVVAMHRAWIREEVPGVRPLIESIKQAGIITALLSNTNEEHFEPLSQTPTLQLLDHCFVSHELGRQKPESEIFIQVENQLGLQGNQMVYFDDTRENVLAAEQRGWRAECIDPMGDVAGQMAQRLNFEGVKTIVDTHPGGR